MNSWLYSHNILTCLLLLTNAQYPIYYWYVLGIILLSRSPDWTSLYRHCSYTKTFVSHVCHSEWSATGDALTPLLFKFALKMPLQVRRVKIEFSPYFLVYENLLSEDTGNLPHIRIWILHINKNFRKDIVGLHD